MAKRIIKVIKKKRYPFITGIILVLLVTGAGTYYFSQYQKNQLINSPTKAAEIEHQNIVAAAGRLFELPKDEVPTIATVSDVTKLADQPFFANAKNGDRVLIYTKAKQAILYNPGQNKIVNVGPIATAEPSTAVAGASTSARTDDSIILPVRVALYNGTSTAGLARRVEKEITEKMSTVSVTERTNASAFTYTSTLVIDLSGKHAAAAKQLAQQLDGQVEKSLPVGEKEPDDADVLVILGNQ
jgi:hypothetical protein